MAIEALKRGVVSGAQRLGAFTSETINKTAEKVSEFMKENSTLLVMAIPNGMGTLILYRYFELDKTDLNANIDKVAAIVFGWGSLCVVAAKLYDEIYPNGNENLNAITEKIKTVLQDCLDKIRKKIPVEEFVGVESNFSRLLGKISKLIRILWCLRVCSNPFVFSLFIINKLLTAIFSINFTQLTKGFVLGACEGAVTDLVVEKILELFNIPNEGDPMHDNLHNFDSFEVLEACVIAPIVEELIFRGILQESLKAIFSKCYGSIMEEEKAKKMAVITAIFFSSIAFGLVHFSNASVYDCDPKLFLHQVIGATLGGLAFGAAKEITGSIYTPIGMHMGNNTLAYLVHLLAHSAGASENPA